MTIGGLLDRIARPAAPVFLAVGLVASVGALAVALAYDLDVHDTVGGGWWIIAPSTLLAGGLITFNRPRHPVGWTFLWSGFLYALSIALATLVLSPSDVVPVSDAWGFVVADTIAVSSMPLMLLAMLLFPDGRPLSRRWRVVAWLLLPVGVIGGLATLFVGSWGGDPAASRTAAPGPLADRFGDLGGVLSDVFFPGMTILILASAASLVVRYRRSGGDTRKQLQWIAAAGALVVIVLVVMGMLSGGVEATRPGLETLVLATSFALIPLAATVAVLKYRLYDIDIVINRAVVVAALGAFITAVYVGIVAGLGAVVGTRGQRDLALSIVATAVVAVAFQPVRRRVQHLANRLVYGERATPYEVLSRFSRRSTEGSGDVLDDIAALLAEGTGAERTAVYGRVGDELRPEARWPSDGVAVPVLDVDDPADPGSDLTLPVEHEGEVLGLVAITKPRGQPLIDADRDLAERLAGGLGILLRNRRLTGDLQRRVDELQRSRRRLVAAQDDTRRKLERDLHDGPQQHLVGLKVQVGLLRHRAEEAGAMDTLGLLEQLADDADGAIDAVRDVARGIYPPLLAEEGIAGAVTTQARKLPVPVTVQAPGLGRYAPHLEAAIYFCILEALTNTVKYADAASVVVTMSQRDGELRVSVTDDGQGFEPEHATGSGLANMADRVDALGGTVTVTSGPGRGTSVELRLPAPLVPEPV